jgi:hypothetical protein
MTNRHRGEIEAVLGGRTRKLRLTLGALAALEHRLGDDDILALLKRFEDGRIRTADCVAVLEEALRGAGECVDAEEVAAFGPDGISTVVRLLEAAFGE